MSRAVIDVVETALVGVVAGGADVVIPLATFKPRRYFQVVTIVPCVPLSSANIRALSDVELRPVPLCK